MKTLIVLLIIFSVSACSDPMHVTTHTDDRGFTSGTLGGARAENSVPIRPTDSLRQRDSLKQ